MKKLLKVLLIIVAVLVIMGIGFAACVGGVASSVNDAIEETDKQIKEENAQVAEMAKDMKWTVKTKDGMLTANAVFKNTSDKTIEYVQFNYKVVDKDGTTLEDSFTNITNVKAGESVKVEISSFNYDDKNFKITEVKATAL